MSSSVRIESAEQFNQLLNSSKIVIADCMCPLVALPFPSPLLSPQGIVLHTTLTMEEIWLWPVYTYHLFYLQSMPTGANHAKR